MKRRKPRDEAKELAEREVLSLHWRYWHEENLREALGGPDGFTVKAVMDLLTRIETTPASVLLDKVKSITWTPVSYETRLTILHQINTAVTNMREKRGLASIDDPLPGEPDNLFRLVKAEIFELSPTR